MTTKTTKIVLNSYYTIKEFLELPQALHILSWSRKFDLYLPTECVIATPSIQVPRVARAYTTNFLYFRKDVITYDDFNTEQRKKPSANRTAAYDVPSVHLFEYWEDDGDDGHVNYSHRGYFFSTFDKFQDRQYPVDYLRDLYHEWRMGVEDAYDQ